MTKALLLQSGTSKTEILTPDSKSCVCPSEDMIKKMKLYRKQTKPISCKTRSHCESKHPMAIQMTSKASHDMLVS